MFWQNKKKIRFFDECRVILDFLRSWLLKLQQTVLSNTVILTEINKTILLSIEGYCVCRDRYPVFRKLPHSRKLYLCMNSAGRIFFSTSFLSVYEVVRPAKKKKKQFAWLACLHRTPTSNTE